MAKDLLENLFDSIDLIVNNKLMNLNYDKTERCSIETVRGNNEYYVSNGATKYVAFSQNDTKYKAGDSVYVTIPQGDYNNKKLIIGKYDSETKDEANWVSPMENFVNITENLCEQGGNLNAEKWALNANDPNNIIKRLWTDKSENVYSGYDRLCITGEFLTSFKEEVINGSYGLILTGNIEFGENNQESGIIPGTSQEKKVNFACLFDEKDMIGDPYSFDTWFNQEKMFEVEKNSKISNLELYLYQGKVGIGQDWEKDILINDFDKHGEYKFANWKYDSNNEPIEDGFYIDENHFDIEVKNISVNFGYSYDSYTEETAILFSKDPLGFSNGNINKALKLRWVHFNNGKTYSITDIEHESLKFHDVKIHWYKYNPAKEKEDKIAGFFWEEIKVLNLFNHEAILNPEWKEEKFKVIIEYDGNLIKSDEIVFTNPSGKNNYGEVITNLKINFPKEDRYKGIYYIYGEDLLTNVNTELPSSLEATFTSVNNEALENVNDIICWKIPANNTMIKPPEDGVEFSKEAGDLVVFNKDTKSIEFEGIEFKPDKDYHQIIRKIKKDENNNSLVSRTQKYRIKNAFSGITLNKILCTVYRSNSKFTEAEVELKFGQHTTSGTKYTLVVDWDEYVLEDKYIKDTDQIRDDKDRKTISKPAAMTIGDTEKWVFNIDILDANQQRITPPEGGWDISLNWYEERIYDYTRIAGATLENFDDDISDIFTLYPGSNIKSKKPYLLLKTTSKNPLKQAQFQILNVKVNYDGYELSNKIPIPLRSSRDVINLSGPTRIYYDSAGYNPRYDKSDYKLTNKEGQDVAIKTISSNLTCKSNTNNRNQWPNIDTKGKSLSVPDTYLPSAESNDKYDGVSVVFRDNNDNIIWVQPIYVTTDPYNYKLFNEWNGKMTIDEEKGYVLSSLLGAGKKDAENKYSGVVMGTLSTLGGQTPETGLLGFDKGIQSFGFLNNGKAFIGKPGVGRINFDGENGYIMSQNFNGFGTAGTAPGVASDGKLNDSSINWGTKTPQGVYIGLSTGNAYFAGNIYASAGTVGNWKIMKNRIESSDGKTKWFYVSSKDDSYPNWIEAYDNEVKFYVSKNGKLFSKEAEITGTLTAGAKIGGSGLFVEDWGFYTSGGGKYAGMQNGGTFALAVGITNIKDWSQAPFRVKHDGSLYAKSATFDTDCVFKGKLSGVSGDFSGTITATSGTIKNLTINGNIFLGDGKIYSGNNTSGDSLKTLSFSDGKSGISVDRIYLNTSGSYYVALGMQGTRLVAFVRGQLGGATSEKTYEIANLSALINDVT